MQKQHQLFHTLDNPPNGGKDVRDVDRRPPQESAGRPVIEQRPSDPTHVNPEDCKVPDNSDVNDNNNDMAKKIKLWPLEKWWGSPSSRHFVAFFTFFLIVLSAGIAVGVWCGDIEAKMLRTQKTQLEADLKKAEERILQAESAGIIDRMVLPSWLKRSPSRINILIVTILMETDIRTRIIEPYSAGWTRRNGEERFLAIEKDYKEIKRQAKNLGFLYQASVIVEAFDTPPDRAELKRIYAEFTEIDSGLTSALHERNPVNTCKYLRRWQKNNIDYLVLASRRLYELVAQSLAESVWGGPCIVD